MRYNYSRIFLIIISSISIGSILAISEKLLTKRIDSFLPESSEVLTFSRPGTITILSSNGTVIQKLGPATREKVNYKEMPLLIKQAFIASEDRRFYKHNGLDPWGITRAIKHNFNEREIQEGASTITQQLARLVFLSQTKTITRKIKEAALAVKIERQLSKEEILEQYLNNVYLGSSAYGVSDASWIYFSKTPKLLTLEEVALIAGLAPAPSLFSPLVDPSLALKRRSIVLERMYKEGFISKMELSKAMSSSLKLNPSTPKYLESTAPFFSSWVLEQLPLYLTQEEIESGGLIIHTTLNTDWQRKAKQILNEYSIRDIEGAIVSIDPNNGFVKALVGGKNFNRTKFNRATQAFRSPGSTFKVFTYAAALKRGFSPEDIVEDKPRCWDEYCPENFEKKYLGKVSITDSFKHSLNTVAVYLLNEVGFDEVISTANSLGIGNERKLEKYYPLAIGALEETVLNMTAAYAAITNRGIYNQPTLLKKIEGADKKIIWIKEKTDSEKNKALEPRVADDLNFMLNKAVSEGTGQAARIKNRYVTGKTGTSEGARDIWFIGSIPQLTTGVWFGYDNNR